MYRSLVALAAGGVAVSLLAGCDMFFTMAEENEKAFNREQDAAYEQGRTDGMADVQAQVAGLPATAHKTLLLSKSYEDGYKRGAQMEKTLQAKEGGYANGYADGYASATGNPTSRVNGPDNEPALADPRTRAEYDYWYKVGNANASQFWSLRPDEGGLGVGVGAKF